MLPVNKNNNNIIPGEIIKYLISIQQHPMFIQSKINYLKELNNPNYNTIQNIFNKH